MIKYILMLLLLFPTLSYSDTLDEKYEKHLQKARPVTIKRLIDLCIQEVYCENDHENILQVMIPYDFILDQVDAETFNNIMSSLGKADRA